jgi:hypothetical protein
MGKVSSPDPEATFALVLKHTPIQWFVCHRFVICTKCYFARLAHYPDSGAVIIVFVGYENRLKITYCAGRAGGQ